METKLIERNYSNDMTTAEAERLHKAGWQLEKIAPNNKRYTYLFVRKKGS